MFPTAAFQRIIAILRAGSFTNVSVDLELLQDVMTVATYLIGQGGSSPMQAASTEVSCSQSDCADQLEAMLIAHESGDKMFAPTFAWISLIPVVLDLIQQIIAAIQKK